MSRLPCHPPLQTWPGCWQARSPCLPSASRTRAARSARWMPRHGFGPPPLWMPVHGGHPWTRALQMRRRLQSLQMAPDLWPRVGLAFFCGRHTSHMSVPPVFHASVPAGTPPARAAAPAQQHRPPMTAAGQTAPSDACCPTQRPLWGHACDLAGPTRLAGRCWLWRQHAQRAAPRRHDNILVFSHAVAQHTEFFDPGGKQPARNCEAGFRCSTNWWKQS